MVQNSRTVQPKFLSSLEISTSGRFTTMHSFRGLRRCCSQEIGSCGTCMNFLDQGCDCASRKFSSAIRTSILGFLKEYTVGSSFIAVQRTKVGVCPPCLSVGEKTWVALQMSHLNKTYPMWWFYPRLSCHKSPLLAHDAFYRSISRMLRTAYAMLARLPPRKSFVRGKSRCSYRYGGSTRAKGYILI